MILLSLKFFLDKTMSIFISAFIYDTLWLIEWQYNQLCTDPSASVYACANIIYTLSM